MPLETYEKINKVVLSLQFGRCWNRYISQALIFLFSVAVLLSACRVTKEEKGQTPPSQTSARSSPFDSKESWEHVKMLT